VDRKDKKESKTSKREEAEPKKTIYIFVHGGFEKKLQHTLPPLQILRLKHNCMKKMVK